MRRRVCMVFSPHHPKRTYNEDERKTVGKETPCQSKHSKGNARQGWSNHARQLKLSRVHRDRVGEIFAAHQIVSHRQIRRTRERHATSSHKREPQHHPTIDNGCRNQSGKTERRESRNDLCVKQQSATIDQVGKYASEKCKNKSRSGRHEGVESEPERGVS